MGLQSGCAGSQLSFMSVHEESLRHLFLVRMSSVHAPIVPALSSVCFALALAVRISFLPGHDPCSNKPRQLVGMNVSGYI